MWFPNHRSNFPWLLLRSSSLMLGITCLLRLVDMGFYSFKHGVSIDGSSSQEFSLTTTTVVVTSHSLWSGPSEVKERKKEREFLVSTSSNLLKQIEWETTTLRGQKNQRLFLQVNPLFMLQKHSHRRQSYWEALKEATVGANAIESLEGRTQRWCLLLWCLLGLLLLSVSLSVCLVN